MRVRGSLRQFGSVRLTDVLIMLGYGALAVGLAVLSAEPPYATPLWTMVSLGLCGLVVLAARHRYPRHAFAGAMVLMMLSLAFGSGAEAVLAVVFVYSAGLHRSGLGTWVSCGIAMLCGAAGALALLGRGSIGPPILGLAPPMAPRDTLLDWANFAVVIAVTLLVTTLWATNVGHRRRHIEELVDRAEQLARERDQRAEVAKALERERIAREMHDVIAHSLSVMIAISDGAHAATDERPDEAKQAIARVAETGRRTLAEVRRLLGTVRGDDRNAALEHAPQPGAEQLPSLAAEFSAAGLPVRLMVTGSMSADPALGLTVYRIVQESLTNVLRHAEEAPSATVTVTWMTDEVTICVRNEGPPATLSSNAGRGILGMRERVALYDGTIEAGPDNGGGWRVFARLRWEER